MSTQENTFTYLRNDAAALRMGLRPQTLERMRQLGTSPPYIKYSRRVLYRADLLDAWLAEHVHRCTAETEIGKADQVKQAEAAP